MRLALRQTAVSMASHCPVPSCAEPSAPVVLMYHSIPDGSDKRGVGRRAFEEHLLFLRLHFSIRATRELHDRPAGNARTEVSLTFDDGFRNSAEVVAPLLRKHRIPATFFVPSRHVTPGKYLWFAYLKMLEQRFPYQELVFRGERIDLSPARRRASVKRLEEELLDLSPHPAAMYEAIDNELPRLEDFVPAVELHDQIAGMTGEQLEELAADPLFEVGGHTVDHPLLTRCQPDEAVRQIAENKVWLERVCGTRCESLAYPGADYDQHILDQCSQVGFRRAYAEFPQIRPGDRLEIARVGVYYPSVDELAVKIRFSRFIGRLRRLHQALSY